MGKNHIFKILITEWVYFKKINHWMSLLINVQMRQIDLRNIVQRFVLHRRLWHANITTVISPAVAQLLVQIYHKVLGSLVHFPSPRSPPRKSPAGLAKKRFLRVVKLQLEMIMCFLLVRDCNIGTREFRKRWRLWWGWELSWPSSRERHFSSRRNLLQGKVSFRILNN